ncbi:MAG: zinc-ribbon domain-containing protein, partial [Deltaproteobacteria bacterium]|nr:zinc-ribbon domain-containing protein [Deltaproteobacteria bacterium]
MSARRFCMLNVQCPSCSAPYSLSEKRVPASGMKMRCPKCGSSFLVMQDGSVTGGADAAAPAAPAPSAPPKAPPPPKKTIQSMGAMAPPAAKKSLFTPRATPEVEADDPFGGGLDLGLPSDAPSPGAPGDLGGSSDFGSLDIGLDLGAPDGLEVDLPAPAAPAPPKPAAKPAAPKPAAPTASAFDDLPAPAGFDDLPAPTGFDDLP